MPCVVRPVFRLCGGAASRCGPLAVALVAFPSSLAAHAEAEVEGIVEEIVVVATKTERPLWRTAAQVEIFDRESARPATTERPRRDRSVRAVVGGGRHRQPRQQQPIRFERPLYSRHRRQPGRAGVGRRAAAAAVRRWRACRQWSLGVGSDDHQAHRGAARTRVGSVRLGCDRRRGCDPHARREGPRVRRRAASYGRSRGMARGRSECFGFGDVRLGGCR